MFEYSQKVSSIMKDKNDYKDRIMKFESKYSVQVDLVDQIMNNRVSGTGTMTSPRGDDIQETSILSESEAS